MPLPRICPRSYSTEVTAAAAAARAHGRGTGPYQAGRAAPRRMLPSRSRGTSTFLGCHKSRQGPDESMTRLLGCGDPHTQPLARRLNATINRSRVGCLHEVLRHYVGSCARRAAHHDHVPLPPLPRHSRCVGQALTRDQRGAFVLTRDSIRVFGYSLMLLPAQKGGTTGTDGICGYA